MDRFNKLPRMGRWIVLGMALASGITAQEPVEEPEQATDPGASSQNSPKTGESSSEAPKDEEEELRQFTPSEQIRADSEVRFPADI